MISGPFWSTCKPFKEDRILFPASVREVLVGRKCEEEVLDVMEKEKDNNDAHIVDVMFQLLKTVAADAESRNNPTSQIDTGPPPITWDVLWEIADSPSMSESILQCLKDNFENECAIDREWRDSRISYYGGIREVCNR